MVFENLPFSVPGLCISTLGAMTFLLGLKVSGTRNKHKVAGVIKNDASNPVWIASRAHGNHVEYAPTVIGLMIWIYLHQYPSWMDGVMIAFTLSRFLFTYGLLAYPTMNKPTKPRFFGAVGTYLFGTILAGCAGYVSLQK